MQIIISKEIPILEALKNLSPGCSNNMLRSFVEKRRVLLDEKVLFSVQGSVRSGQKLRLLPRIGYTEEGIKIIYEDKDLVVIEKPEGLLSVATLYQKNNTAHCFLKNRKKGKRVIPVHRLDRETSGLMIFAYSETAKEDLKEQFFHHTIERQYVGIIEGTPPSVSGTWESHLVEEEDYSVHSSNEGKLAITHYTLIEKKKKHSLMCFTLETGKKNQIRVHASEAKCPISGDKKYGAKSAPWRRLCLHAQLLSFLHPVSKKQLKFESPFPMEF